MLKNNFTIAWRHIRKDRVFSFITIFGLSISIAVCILIFQYAIFELGYDRFNINADHTYRITANYYESNQRTHQSASCPQKIGPVIKEKLTDVLQSARLISTRGWFDCAMKYNAGSNTIIFNERNLYFADPSLFSIFSSTFKYGDKSQALEKPYSAVLSETAARRYFGEEDAIGKVMRLKGSFDENDYLVTGIMTDLPPDSHIDVDILLSISSLERNPYYNNFDAYTYVLLGPRTSTEAMRVKLHDFVSTYLPILNVDKTQIQLDIQPITEIHLNSSLEDEIRPGGNPRSIYFMLLVAISILLIAWINYINLATARSISRAKEVGIRKVSGASRYQLVNQFLLESIIINALSISMALILVYFLSPLFYQITGLTVSYDRLFQIDVSLIGLFGAIIFCTGIFLSGLYPARVISSHNPALVLKGKFSGKGGAISLRKALVVFQFTCAIGLTITVLTFNQQFRFMQSKDLGIDINRTIIIRAPAAFDSTYLARLGNFKSKLQSNSIISSVTTSTAIPGDEIGWTGAITKEDDKSSSGLNFIVNVIDPDFISSYNLRFLAGRNLEISDFPSLHFGSKIEPVILNKTAIAQLGFRIPEEAIGTAIYWGKNKCRVVGVIDDFHQQSFRSALQPTLFTANIGPLMSLKLGKGVNDDNLSHSISTIHEAWSSLFPDYPFDYFFLDEFYSKQYSNDKQVMTLFHAFCGLAILVSCLGLFGLSTLTTRQRTKEMSIRKILGAPTLGLIIEMSREFLVLIILASVTAIPISYFGIGQWLQSFAFHIDLSGWLFVVPVLFILTIALLTVSFQTLRAVNSNPVETLKYE